MNLRLERIVPFPRDAVYAWWTDFREDDQGRRGAPAASRREIVRREGNELWLRERARRPAPVTVDEHILLDPPDGYMVVARYPGAEARYRYRFEPIGEGCRIVLEAEVRPRHVRRILLPLVRGYLRRYAERDTDFHVRSMAEDLGASP